MMEFVIRIEKNKIFNARVDLANRLMFFPDDNTYYIGQADVFLKLFNIINKYFGYEYTQEV